MLDWIYCRSNAGVTYHSSHRCQNRHHLPSRRSLEILLRVLNEVIARRKLLVRGACQSHAIFARQPFEIFLNHDAFKGKMRALKFHAADRRDSHFGRVLDAEKLG
jgi:hypothetical protein